MTRTFRQSHDWISGHIQVIWTTFINTKRSKMNATKLLELAYHEISPWPRNIHFLKLFIVDLVSATQIGHILYVYSCIFSFFFALFENRREERWTINHMESKGVREILRQRMMNILCINAANSLNNRILFYYFCQSKELLCIPLVLLSSGTKCFTQNGLYYIAKCSCSS